jgi:long-chain fatty acid transport protein
MTPITVTFLGNHLNINRLRRCIPYFSYVSSIVATILMSPGVVAGGFQLSDHSVTSLGRAHAGFGIVGDDASAAFFNPAGMSLLKDSQLQSGLAFIRPKSKFTNTGSTDDNTGTNDDGGQNTITPNFYYVRPINNQWHFGLGFTAPFATHTSYTDNFIGRYSGLETKITTVNINPSFSYTLNEHVAVGFGISYQRLDAKLSGALIPAVSDSTLTIEGDSAAWGYNLGAMLSFEDESRLGISYRSKVTHDIRGTATFADLTPATNGVFDANADFTAPESAYIGYTNPLSDRWQLSLGYRWTRWSRFQQLDVLFPDGVASQNSLLVTQWNDSETMTIGADYRVNQQWVVRAGFALDETPVPDATRTVRTVDSDRQWYSVGATYQYSKQLQFDFAYRYISFDSAPVDQDITRSGSSIGQLTGSYNNVNIHTLAAQINYSF